MSDELDEIQAIFFEECAEGLATAEDGLSAMAAGGVSAEVIAGVFRAVHSIKGGSGAFGHIALAAFSHCFENVLDEVRAGRIAATPAVTKVMLAAFDLLADHVAAAQGTAGTPDDRASLAALEDVLAGKVGGEVTADAPSLAPIDADEFGFSAVAVSIDDMEDFASAESTTGASWTVRFRPSRAALANACEPMLVIRELEALGGTVTRVDSTGLPALRDLDPENGYLEWTISVPGLVAESEIVECFDFVAPDSLVEIIGESDSALGMSVAGDALPFIAPTVAPAMMSPVPALTVVARNDPEVEPKEGRAGEASSQTIRVDLTKLDLLLNLVGELVIRGSILADRLSPSDQERVELPELARLTREIQDNVMSLRAQPIRHAFSRVPRMLRDLSAGTGKQVELETIGETTEVDKGVIEKIGDPLTHLIRNAMDHGIELPEERIALGKPAHGTIRLSAEQRGARIFVRVSDDGRGIDRARVRAKAIEKGIIDADAILSNEEIDQLICAPGFSTAETISSISGRGVGMDVVRANVEALGGRVDIASIPGEGTTFTMALPLTLAILDGMIVRLSGQRFVLPLANVVEAVRPEPGQVRSMSPTSEVIELRGSYRPIKRLSDIFGIRDDRREPEDSLVIIVESESAGHVGIMVDTIDDRREVVIKSLDQNLHPIRGLGGATILGDGSIALILDIEALVAPAHGAALKYNLKGLAA